MMLKLSILLASINNIISNQVYDSILYDDIQTYPKYEFIFESDFKFENKIEQKEFKSYIIDLNRDLKYQCHFKKNIKVKKQDTKLDEIKLQQLLEKGQHIIENKKGCKTRKAGDWRYKFCYNKKLVQYLPLKTTQENSENKQEVVEVLYDLGTYGNFKSNSINHDFQKMNIRFTNDYNFRVPFYWFETWTKGSFCQQVNYFREIEIRYVCGSPLDQEGLLSIKEPSICQYIAYVHVPELCKIGKFNQKQEEITQKTLCNPIIPTKHNNIKINQNIKYQHKENNFTKMDKKGLFLWFDFYLQDQILTCDTQLITLPLDIFIDHVLFVLKDIQRYKFNNEVLLEKYIKRQQHQLYKLIDTKENKIFGVVHLEYFLKSLAFVDVNYEFTIPSKQELELLLLDSRFDILSLYSTMIPPKNLTAIMFKD